MSYSKSSTGKLVIWKKLRRKTCYTIKVVQGNLSYNKSYMVKLFKKKTKNISCMIAVDIDV